MDWIEQVSLCALLWLLWLQGTVCLGSYAATVITGDDTFSIKHEGMAKCLMAQQGSLKLGECSAEVALSWKWVSGHRLFHTGSSACLGLDVPSKMLFLTNCSALPMPEWHCSEGSVYTIYQMRLSIAANGTVVVKREAPDSWSRGGTSENICQHPYQIIHTSGGNAYGAPCEFPFLYKGTWHHSCLPGNHTQPLAWCSTTDNYDQDQMWGNCLKHEEGCSTLWDAHLNGQCYQVVSTAMVTWHEARDACRSQGGDLFSVSSPEELQNFKTGMDLPDKLWIGLNHLDWAQGWEWSDGSSLAYAPWDAESFSSRSTLLASDCGVIYPNLRFGSEVCEMKLPYICEKKENNTQTKASVKVEYKPTQCESGWIPWQGYCYKLYGTKRGESKPYTSAQQVCVKNSAQLASLHHLEDIEMLSTQFEGEGLNRWIGLKAESNTNFFRWEDGSNVSFTYWGRTQPPLLSPSSPSCAFLEVDNSWFVETCNRSLPFLCKKKGEVNESTSEDGCPVDGDWRRHGRACYKVDASEVTYKNSCQLIINNRFEQAFVNSLLKEHLSSKVLYFWTGLQDSKLTGEYQWFSQDGQADRVMYTNWRWQEPANAGGCAVLSTASPLGQWSVKNCTLFKAGSICKITANTKNPSPPAPEPTESDPNTPCPPGWVSKEGIQYCYKVFHKERLSRKRSWEEAELFCEALGAHLPSFTKVEEMTTLHYIMRDSISDDRFFWVGLNRRNPNNENRWEWSDGRPVSMTVFPQEFHEDDEYNRDCAAFKSLKGNFKLLFFFLLHDVPVRPFYSSAFHCDAKLEWVCQIPRGQTPKNPEWYNPDGHHTTSVIIDNQEFWFVNEPKLSFEEASIYCSSNKSKLATPQTINAARLLRERLYKNAGQKNWWVDLRQTGPHVPLRFSYMHLYQSAFLDRCTSFSADSFMPDYQVRCEVKLPFVCETLNVTSAETGRQDSHLPGQACGSGTLAFRDKCYKVIKPKYMSFKAANEMCETLKGSLLSIRDQAEQDFITTLLPELPQKLWIGLKLRLHDTQWVDNTPVTYLNFNPLLHGQLRPISVNMFEQEGLELCAYMYNNAHSDMLGTWDYTSCSDEQYVAICQYCSDKPVTSEVPMSDFQVNNHTFKVVLQEKLNWYDALVLCKANGMDLASVADGFLQAVLTVHATKVGHPLWIGLFNKHGHYYWSDHSHTVFSRWGPEVSEGGCVYLDIDGYWKATECGEQLQGAICHIPQDEKVIPFKDAGKCPHKTSGANWIPFKNNCYTFLLKSHRWQEHDKNNDQQTCQVLVGTGDILTIRNEEENEFIRRQLQPFRDLAKFVWLGMYKDENEEYSQRLTTSSSTPRQQIVHIPHYYRQLVPPVRHPYSSLKFNAGSATLIAVSPVSDRKLKWHDGTKVQYSNWRDGRPNITQPFMAGLSLNGEWELIKSKLSFAPFKQAAIVVCKIEHGPKDEFRKSPADIQSPAGYNFFLLAKKLNWYQALYECSSEGGHLVSIHNETTNSDMALISKWDGFPLWIGLSRHDLTGWPYEWSDGTQLQFQPEGFVGTGRGSEEKCVYVDSKGSWSAVNCHAELDGAICYKSISKSSVTAHPSDNCPQSNGKASWIQFKSHCYAIDMTLYNYSVFTMEDAKSICGKIDRSSQLLTIKSKDENDFVSRHVAENPFITSRVWLGLKSVSEDVTWMDGTTLDFSNWGYFQPQPGCAVMVSTNGTWSTTDCTESRSRIICKAPAKLGGTPVALAFFIIVLLCIVAVVAFIIYKKTRHRFSSTVRYQRNFDEADSSSMIADVE